GAVVADRAHEADGRVGAMAVELGGLVAVRAGHTGAVVAVFFPARRRSKALAAILWAKARTWNSLSPKRWASSVSASAAARASTSASTGSRMARARSPISAFFSGGCGVDGMVASGPTSGFSSAVPAFALVYKDSTNFQDARGQRWDALGVVQREQGDRARFPWL